MHLKSWCHTYTDVKNKTIQTGYEYKNELQY